MTDNEQNEFLVEIMNRLPDDFVDSMALLSSALDLLSRHPGLSAEQVIQGFSLAIMDSEADLPRLADRN